MRLLDRLERKFGNLAIENLTVYLIAGQVFSFILFFAAPVYSHIFNLNGSLMLTGEWWRSITMLLSPISLSPFWAAFTWYLYYIYGTGLEKVWGSFRYTLYFFISWIATIAAALLFPDKTITNTFIYGSIFFAFAFLYPNFTLLLFFIIPVKIKWLAVLGWIGVGYALIFSDLETKIITALSISNFFLFFGSEVLLIVKDRIAFTARRSGNPAPVTGAYMVCARCGATEKDRKIFYYCHTCAPERCFCQDHIKDHNHKIVH